MLLLSGVKLLRRRRRDMHEGSCAGEILSLSLGHSCAKSLCSRSQGLHGMRSLWWSWTASLTLFLFSSFSFPPPFIFSPAFFSVAPASPCVFPLPLLSAYPPRPFKPLNKRSWTDFLPSCCLWLLWKLPPSERIPKLQHTAATLFFPFFPRLCFTSYPAQQHAFQSLFICIQ